MEFNIKLNKYNTSEQDINKYINYCKENNITKTKLVKMALDVYFKNRKNQLMALDREQLIDIILKTEENGQTYSAKKK